MSVAGKASISRIARRAMYCAVHSPIPRMVRRRITVSSMLPNGRNRFGSAAAASATAFNAVKRAPAMPSPMEAVEASRFAVRKADADTEALSSGQMGHLDTSGRSVNFDRAQITIALDDFHALNGSRAQEVEHAVPVVRRTVAKPKRDVLPLVSRGSFPSQSAGRPLKQPAKYFVEAPHAAESGGHGNVRHRHPRVMNELLRE